MLKRPRPGLYAVTPDGLETITRVDNEGNMHVTYRQDAEAAFEAVRTARNDTDRWSRQVKSGFVHAFHIPNGVVTELHSKGINVYTATAKEIAKGLRDINRYEACDMTGKRTLV